MALAGQCIDSCAELFLYLFAAASKARHHDCDILWRLKSVKPITDYEVRAAWSSIPPESRACME